MPSSMLCPIFFSLAFFSSTFFILFVEVICRSDAQTCVVEEWAQKFVKFGNSKQSGNLAEAQFE